MYISKVFFTIFLFYNGILLFYISSAAKNTLIFERALCSRNLNNTAITYVDCSARLISRTNMRIYAAANFSKPLYDLNAHGVFYYKYKYYEKFPIDLWENICEWLNGGSTSFILDSFFGKVMNHTNIKKCPIQGFVYMKVDNISFSVFSPVPLVPSGRYRVDINITEGNRNEVLTMAKVYFAVSDHRIEQY